MTNGELFIAENPNMEFKLNGSCVWIYFDGVNHYTMPVEWGDKEISLFNKIRAEIEHVKDNPLFGMVSNDTILEVILEIIDKYRNEVSE